MWSAYSVSCPQLSQLGAWDAPLPSWPDSPPEPEAPLLDVHERFETLYRLRGRQGPNSLRAIAAKVVEMQADPDTPARLRPLLGKWTSEHGRKAVALLVEFRNEFQALSLENAGGRPDNFERDTLPSLYEAAIVCVALGMDRMPAIRDWLHRHLKADQRRLRHGGVFKTPVHALAWTIAGAFMASAPSLKALRGDDAAFALEGPNGRPWLPATAVLAATPLLAWLDSVLDAGWAHLEHEQLLQRDEFFGNELAARLHEQHSVSEQRAALHDALSGLIAGVLMRVGVGAAWAAGQPGGIRAAEHVALSAMLETFAFGIAPSVWRSFFPLQDHGASHAHLRALSSTRFTPWAFRTMEPGQGQSARFRSTGAAMLRQALKPSTLVRAALLIAPTLAARSVVLNVLPYPAGLNTQHESSPDPTTQSLGPTIDPALAALTGAAATMLATAALYASPFLRNTLARTLDPAVERLAQRVFQSVAHGGQRLAAALGWPGTDTPPEPGTHTGTGTGTSHRDSTDNAIEMTALSRPSFPFPPGRSVIRAAPPTSSGATGIAAGPHRAPRGLPSSRTAATAPASTSASASAAPRGRGQPDRPGPARPSMVSDPTAQLRPSAPSALTVHAAPANRSTRAAPSTRWTRAEVHAPPGREPLLLNLSDDDDETGV